MGIDILLYAETVPTAQELETARALFRRSRIADDYEHDGEIRWQCLEFEDETEWTSRRVVANVTPRFYGEGYERGDWPSIYGAIRLLQAAFPQARVFYGGDTDDRAPEVTPQRLADLWEHYLGADGNRYFDRHHEAVRPSEEADHE